MSLSLERTVIDFSSLEPITDRNAKLRGSYYPTSDATLKTIKSISIGERRPLLGQPEHTRPGPGDYTLDPFAHIGTSEIVNSYKHNEKIKLQPIKMFTAENWISARPKQTFGRKYILCK